jgi:3-methyladenine DNA glycosylase AlkC
MAAKTTANWSQGNSNNETVRRVVHTCANTPLPQWKEMVKTELEGSEVIFESLTVLSLLHAWENGDTPYSYAYTLKDRLKRQRNKASFVSTPYPPSSYK